MKTHHRWLLLMLGLLFAVSGCDKSGLVKVTGRLTYKGEPVPSTQVMFLPEDGRRRSTGVTDDDGYFTLRNSRDEYGAFRGQQTVVLKYVQSGEEEEHKTPPKASRELKEIIAKYDDPATSTLHYEITGSGQVIEIKLE